MRTRTSRTPVHSFRGLILLTVLAIPAGILSSACGATASPQPSVAAQPRTATAAPVAPQPSSAPVQPIGDGDWHGFRGDASRIAVGVEGPIGNPVLKWRFQAGGGVPNNIAVVGDAVYFASDDGMVHAVSRTLGSELWKTQLQTPTVRGPVAADGRLYLATSRVGSSRSTPAIRARPCGSPARPTTAPRR